MILWRSRTDARNVLGSLVLQPAMTVDLDHPALAIFIIRPRFGFPE